MADNTTTNAGSGGNTIATEDLGGVHYQKNKLAFGAAGAANLVSSKTVNPLPVGCDRTQAAVESVPSSVGVMEAGVDRAVNFTVVAASAAVDNLVVAAQGSGNRILVHGLFVVANGGVNTLTFKTGAVNIGGVWNLAANGQALLPFSPVGWFKTNANEALNLNLTAATAVQGVLAWSIKS